MSYIASEITSLSENSLLLPWPEDISSDYDLNKLDRFKLINLIDLFNAFVDTSSKEEFISKLGEADLILDSLETFSASKRLSVTGSLKQWEIEDYDFYFDVKREQTQDSPVLLIIRSIIIAYKTFLDLRHFGENNNALLTWKKYHWLFFVFLQGNILCMLHLGKEIAKENIAEAGFILRSMAKLMLASGASMIFAGASQRQEYENEIRPTMMPPNVNSPEFSGLMSYDHVYLINLWNKEKKLFKSIPPLLNSAHEEFVDAHKFIALAHKFVCSKYGGEHMRSLKGKRGTALETLDHFNNARRKLIVNSDDQLLNSDSGLKLIHKLEYEDYIKNGFKFYVQLLIKSIAN